MTKYESSIDEELSAARSELAEVRKQKAGTQTVEWWEERFRKLVRESEERIEEKINSCCICRDLLSKIEELEKKLQEKE